MARKKRTSAESGELEMTPMIDMVFQLLIYFVFTIKPIDVAAHLDVFRPSASTPPPNSAPPPKMIQIAIHPQGVVLMNGYTVDLPTLTSKLGQLAAYSKTQTIMISCARDSEHNTLVRVLDVCAENELTNLSVTTMN